MSVTIRVYQFSSFSKESVCASISKKLSKIAYKTQKGAKRWYYTYMYRTLTVDATFVFQKAGLRSVTFLRCIIMKGRPNFVWIFQRKIYAKFFATVQVLCLNIGNSTTQGYLAKHCFLKKIEFNLAWSVQLCHIRWQLNSDQRSLLKPFTQVHLLIKSNK